MIAEILKTGKENAIKGAELAAVTGDDIRGLRRRVQKEREEGMMICSSAAGYYLPADREELAAYYKRYTVYAKRMLKTASAMKRQLDKIEGQEELIA